MTIVNIVEVKGKEINISDLSNEEKNDIAQRLTCQAMTALGYRMVDNPEKNKMQM